MTEEKQIEEILYESHSVGMRQEVMNRAHDIMGSKNLSDLGSIFGNSIGDIPAEKNSYLLTCLAFSKFSTTGLLQ